MTWNDSVSRKRGQLDIHQRDAAPPVTKGGRVTLAAVLTFSALTVSVVRSAAGNDCSSKACIPESRTYPIRPPEGYELCRIGEQRFWCPPAPPPSAPPAHRAACTVRAVTTHDPTFSVSACDESQLWLFLWSDGGRHEYSKNERPKICASLLAREDLPTARKDFLRAEADGSSCKLVSVPQSASLVLTSPAITITGGLVTIVDALNSAEPVPIRIVPSQHSNVEAIEQNASGAVPLPRNGESIVVENSPFTCTARYLGAADIELHPGGTAVVCPEPPEPPVPPAPAAAMTTAGDSAFAPASVRPFPYLPVALGAVAASACGIWAAVEHGNVGDATEALEAAAAGSHQAVVARVDIERAASRRDVLVIAAGALVLVPVAFIVEWALADDSNSNTPSTPIVLGLDSAGILRAHLQF